jgi:transposase-like protein
MNLTDPRFTDPDKAREYLEAQRWPNGPVCPHCGNADASKISAMNGNTHRDGLYQCGECRKQFTVTVGSLMERSKIPLNKWLLAMHLMGLSKKGVSAHQIHRTLEITYQSAWFLCHRIREAMRGKDFSPMGGAGSIVEIDETFIGRKEGVEKRRGGAHKNLVLSLVERGDSARSFHVETTKKEDIIPIVKANIVKETHVMTDDSNTYINLDKDFAAHGVVDHSRKEYSYTDRVSRYVAEFDFRHSNRSALGIEDTERVAKIIKATGGKRLMYRAAGSST